MGNRHSRTVPPVYGSPTLVGINYEGGNIIDQILGKYPQCRAYANIQILMDAPFAGRPKLTGVSRMEQTCDGYNGLLLITKLEEIFAYIKAKYPEVRIVIQVARGKSANDTIVRIIQPILGRLGIHNYELVKGYKTTAYYNVPHQDKTPFVFVNYGMFAVLTEVSKYHVGQICNPVECQNLEYYTKDNGFHYKYKPLNYYAYSGQNIMNSISSIPRMRLFGIADDMPVIHLESYDERHIETLLDGNALPLRSC